MSSQDDAEQLQHYVIRMYIGIALVAVYLYDYLLCLRREINYMWFGRFRAATLFYFGARYLPFAKLLFVVAISSGNPPHCTAWYRFVELLGVVGRAAIIATLLGRTYAIFTYRKAIILVPAALGVAVVILGAYEVFQTYCVSGLAQFGGSSRWGFTISCSRLVLEATVICLLVFQSHIDFRLQGAVQHIGRQSFAFFIFRSGVLYFLTALCVDMLALIFNKQWSWSPEWLRGVMNALPLPVPAILISRFLLELREMASYDARSPEHTSTTPSFGSMHATFVHEFNVNISETTAVEDTLPLRGHRPQSGSDDIERYEMTPTSDEYMDGDLRPTQNNTLPGNMA